ncbi:hypothetical protein ACFC0K_15825 [Streptomyces hydrogenans]|uniref:hypothetical protein n=1 Tax=Streptomyces hydrogenans TaxID=1873719 RepID=UPI0035DF93E3
MPTSHRSNQERPVRLFRAYPYEDWMDKEYADRTLWGGAGRRLPAGQRLFLLRQRLNSFGLTRERNIRPDRAIALYVRTVRGEDVTPIFETLKREAGRRHWRVARMFHDQAELDPAAHPVPEHWPGWRAVRDLIGRGQLDGVLVPDRTHISTNTAAYVNELKAIAERQGFTALLLRETDP